MDVGKRALRAAHAEDRTPMQVRSALIDAWVAALVDRRTFTPMSTAQARDLVTTLADRLIGAVRAPRSDVATAAAASVGATMADARITDPMALERVLVAIGQHLPDIEATGETHETPRPVAISSAFAAGFLRATGQRVLTEQEEMRTAEAVAMRRLREQLRTSQARFRSVFIDSAIGIGIADMDGGIVEVNPAFTAMLGHTAEDFQRIRVEDFFTNGDTEGHQAVYSELVDGARDHLRMEAPFPHADGHTVWTNLTVTVLRDADGTPRYTLAMAEDVSEQRSLREHLRHQALHDPLTGLANRVLFQQRLAAACAAGTRVGVCSIDLDDFKPINDTFGHDVGDAVLRHVARRLEACADGEPATIARMGGDEFVVLVAPSRGQGHVRRLAAKMVTSLERPYAIGALDVRLSASVGIVERAVAGTTPAELMKAADVTLYSAKRRGRGRPEVFEAGRAKDETDRLMLAATLPSALANDEFMLEYQPLVTLKDGAICGVEPLVRWSHPALGRVEPERFVAIAEHSGAIIELGRRILAESCRQAQHWRSARAGADLFVSVNLAARQVREPGFVDEVAAVLAETGLPPAALQLELIERALIDATGQPLDTLEELAAMGVRIAIDDFGTGYSNLAYLDTLPVHTLKLDRAIVTRTHSARIDGAGDAVVTALVELAHTLDLSVTAEGVETAAQADRLRALGCDHAQGWFFAPPASASMIGELLGGVTPLAHAATMGS